MATQYHTPSPSALAFFESLGNTGSYQPKDDDPVVMRINTSLTKAPNTKGVIEVHRKKTIEMRSKQISNFFGMKDRAKYYTIGKDADGLPIIVRK